MADRLDLPHPAKLVPAKQNGIKLDFYLSYKTKDLVIYSLILHMQELGLKQYQI